MNIRFLVCTSFIIALLCHLAILNIFTFVFPIDASAPKPKFFFLGPILTQKDVKHISPKKQASKVQSTMKKLHSSDNNFPSAKHIEKGRGINPFAIRTIDKPLAPEAGELQQKIVIKSLFEVEADVDSRQKEGIEQQQVPDLKIQPYRPLRFHSPK